MCVIMATGKPAPKYIPDFVWYIDGNVTKGFGRKKLFETAQTAMGRRKVEWTEAEQAMWEEVFARTAGPRDEAIKRGRRQMASR